MQQLLFGIPPNLLVEHGNCPLFAIENDVKPAFGVSCPSVGFSVAVGIAVAPPVNRKRNRDFLSVRKTADRPALCRMRIFGRVVTDGKIHMTEGGFILVKEFNMAEGICINRYFFLFKPYCCGGDGVIIESRKSPYSS